MKNKITDLITNIILIVLGMITIAFMVWVLGLIINGIIAVYAVLF